MSQRSTSDQKRSGNASASADQGGRSASTGAGTEDLAAQGQAVAGEIQEQAGRLVDLARQQVSSRLASQKERAAGGADTVALVLQQVAQQFRQQDQGTVAQYVDSAAGQVEQVATALRDQDVEQLIRTVGGYARRQPAPFLAATFALGFLGTRFFRSSSSQEDEKPKGPYGYPSSAAWADRFETGSTATGDYAATGSGASGYGSGAMGEGLGYGDSALAGGGVGMGGSDFDAAGAGGASLAGSSGTGLADDWTAPTGRTAEAEER